MVSAAYLIFLDKEIAKKKVSTRDRLVTILYFTRPVDRKRTTKVGLINCEVGLA